MMKRIMLILCVLFSFAAQAQSTKIQAVVNGDIITTSDLDARLKNFFLLNNLPANEQTMPMASQRVLYQTIDEQIKIQEAKANGINITSKEVDNAYKKFLEMNKGKSLDGFSTNALREQIKADLAWSRLVSMKSFEAKNITQKEVEIARASAIKDINAPKRMISEIYILKNKAKNLVELVETLKKDSARFELYAQQFSDAPSAARGGKLGWVNVGKFDEPLENALKNMKDGDISKPILSGNGYYILKLEKNFDPKKEEAYTPSEAEVKGFLQNKKMETFLQDYMQKLRQKATIEMR